ncbi:hypothetical protein [Nocardioides daphniae]|uniref:hypothetical protein n=1 Tax=Nocardioides daphniae TaxID=402297 RepID=UPI001315A45D|nr:hypothetical protein [Nocardioides daphniae]
MTAEFRRRVVLVVLLIIGVPLVVALAIQSETDPPGVVGDYLDCLPYTTPKSVADINRFVRSTGATPGFAGGDVGASAQLSDGRSLWVFGDTTRPVDEAGASMVRNSLLVMGNGCASVLRSADNGAAVPDREDGVGYWPMSVVAVPDPAEGGDRVAVGLMRVRATGTGMWDFEVLGSSVANFRVPVNGTPSWSGSPTSGRTCQTCHGRCGAPRWRSPAIRSTSTAPPRRAATTYSATRCTSPAPRSTTTSTSRRGSTSTAGRGSATPRRSPT